MVILVRSVAHDPGYLTFVVFTKVGINKLGYRRTDEEEIVLSRRHIIFKDFTQRLDLSSLAIGRYVTRFCEIRTAGFVFLLSLLDDGVFLPLVLVMHFGFFLLDFLARSNQVYDLIENLIFENHLLVDC